jgi:uncharacterized membrane protein YfcA
VPDISVSSVIALLLAGLVGLSLGMLGGGGSILTVPILVYVLGFDPKQAIAMSLGVVGTTSLVGAWRQWKDDNIKLRVAFIFGPVAMVGAVLGARLATYVTGATQLTIFACVMLAAAVLMFRDRREEPAEDQAVPHRMQVGSIVLLGVAVGVLTGLVGVGGGFLIVPALVLLGRVPMRKAVGTSLLVIAMNSASGFVTYLGHTEIPWRFMLEFTAVAIAGMFVGTRLARHVPQAQLKRLFAIFLVAMGLFILWRGR